MATNISNNGAGALYGTFHITSDDVSTLKIGEAVTLETGNTVGYGASGDFLFGIVEHIEGNGDATVQIKGVVNDVATVSGATIATVGKCLTVNGAGKVIKYAGATVTSGAAAVIPTNAIAVNVDSTACTADIIL